MERITFKEFHQKGLKIFEILKTDKIRVQGWGSRYVNVYLHDEKDELYEREGDVLIDKLGKRFRECRLCGSLCKVRYIVPYDGSIQPGGYCLNCRRRHSIMDVKDAKRYGKIL